jgi:tRNA pseudouridine65 synthase
LEKSLTNPIELSLLEVKPLTGRSHQIRRHLQHIGHPIVGDYRHGDQGVNRAVLAETGVVRMLLTSMRLDFRHPYTGELQAITVGRGTLFDQVISQLKAEPKLEICA